jgi:hypothetical protein
MPLHDAAGRREQSRVCDGNGKTRANHDRDRPRLDVHGFPPGTVSPATVGPDGRAARSWPHLRARSRQGVPSGGASSVPKNAKQAVALDLPDSGRRAQSLPTRSPGRPVPARKHFRNDGP